MDEATGFKDWLLGIISGSVAGRGVPRQMVLNVYFLGSKRVEQNNSRYFSFKLRIITIIVIMLIKQNNRSKQSTLKLGISS